MKTVFTWSYHFSNQAGNGTIPWIRGWGNKSNATICDPRFIRCWGAYTLWHADDILDDVVTWNEWAADMTKDENKSKRKNLSVSAGFIHGVRYRYISRYLYSPKRIREPLLARWTEHMRAYYFSSKQQRFFFFFF